MDRRQKTKYYCIIALAWCPIAKLPKTYASKAVKINVFDYPTVVWRPLSSEPPRISAFGTNLILAETRVIGLHLCRWQYRSVIIQIFTVSSERRTCFETECIMTLQGHPRSLILASIESAYMTSYSTLIATLLLSCRVSEILELLYAESHFFSPPPLFGRKFRGVPFGAVSSCWGCKERTSQAT